MLKSHDTFLLLCLSGAKGNAAACPCTHRALEYWQMGTQLHRKQKRNCYAACGSTGKT